MPELPVVARYDPSVTHAPLGSRECYCACHIAKARSSTNSYYGTWLRLRCTARSPDPQTCGDCGRIGKARYFDPGAAPS